MLEFSFNVSDAINVRSLVKQNDKMTVYLARPTTNEPSRRAKICIFSRLKLNEKSFEG